MHLNFPLREPLVPRERAARGHGGRAATARPFVAASLADAPRRRRAGRSCWRAASRGAGAACWWPGATSAATPLGEPRPRSRAARAGRCWPTRCRERVAGRRRSRTTTRCCATPRFAASHRPDLVLRVGDLPVSKPLRTWLAGLDGVRQVALDPEAAWQDPASVLCDSLALEPGDARLRSWPRAIAGARRPATRRTGLAVGAAPTSARPRRSSGCSPASELSEPARRRRARRAAARGGDPVRRLLDAGARHRDVLAGARRPAARALQSRRQRHRRHRLLGVRRGRRTAPARSCC